MRAQSRSGGAELKPPGHSANKPLVDIVKEMGQHARRRASKLRRDVYGEKVSAELTGENGGAIQSENTSIRRTRLFTRHRYEFLRGLRKKAG
jgi:hypothetical protein